MTTLLWRVRPRMPRRVGSAHPFDEHFHRATDEALRALMRTPLDDLDEALEALDLDLVRNEPLAQARGLRAAPRREDEGEGAVVADLLDDLEGLLEVVLALAREADDDVGRERDVGHVLADQRDAVQVALAIVGPPHRAQDPRGA